MKDILLFSHDPGGANTVIPLVIPLRELGYGVRLYGDGIALGMYRHSGLTGASMKEHLGSITTENVEAFLRKERPNFLITGTSAEDFTEKYLWQAADHLGIPSFAILDQWINYGIRFSPWSLHDSASYESVREHRFIPSRVIVMDAYAQDEMVRAKVLPRERILPLGQPYFETLLRRRESLPPVGELRAKLGLSPDAFVIIFVSEPLAKDYGNDPNKGEFWGYTERTVFASFRDAVSRAAARASRQVHVVIKLHPRESESTYSDLQQSMPPLVTITRHQDMEPLELIHLADLVCGMSSMMLIEAAVMGKSILSILIGLCRESPFILERQGIVRSARSESETEERLFKEFIGNGAAPALFKIERHPVRAIIAEMERMLS